MTDVDDRLKTLPTLYALRWTATAQPNGDLRRRSSASTRPPTSTSSGPPSRSTARRPRTSCTPMSTATSATRRRASIPIREDKDDHGDRPVPATTACTNGPGRSPTTHLPRVYNPPSGMIVSANNEVVDSSYPYFIAQRLGPGLSGGPDPGAAQGRRRTGRRDARRHERDRDRHEGPPSRPDHSSLWPRSSRRPADGASRPRARSRVGATRPAASTAWAARPT